MAFSATKTLAVFIFFGSRRKNDPQEENQFVNQRGGSQTSTCLTCVSQEELLRSLNRLN